jgi:uncharacterized small protein (DUF1192 family)
MSKTPLTEPTPEEAAALEAEIERMFAEMEQADERIQRLQDETDRLRAETRALLAALEAGWPGRSGEQLSGNAG